mgnify:CR=1 FL=1
MPGIPNIGLSFADANAQNQNPFAAFLTGGFTFAPVHIAGGTGNRNTPQVTTSAQQTATQTPSTNQSATATATTPMGPVSSPVTPFADGAFGWGNGSSLTAPNNTNPAPATSPASAYLLPVALVAGALILGLALKK